MNYRADEEYGRFQRQEADAGQERQSEKEKLNLHSEMHEARQVHWALLPFQAGCRSEAGRPAVERIWQLDLWTPPDRWASLGRWVSCVVGSPAYLSTAIILHPRGSTSNAVNCLPIVVAFPR